MIPVSKAATSPKALDRIARILSSGRLEHGPTVDEFEQALGRRLGNSRVVAVNCATSALHLAFSLAARPPGEEPATGEVLTTPLTFEGTNWPILANGLRIRWVDVDPATLTMDLDDLAAKISPATRAVVVVDWAGYPVDLARLHTVVDEAADRYGRRPLVVEDAAQAFGASYGGRPLGNHGTICVYSLGPIKLLSSGGGGLLVLPDASTERHVRLRRWHGIDRHADRVSGDYDVEHWGYRFTMNEISAAIGLANLEIVDDLLSVTRANAAFFDRELAGVPGLEHIEHAADREPSFWLYPLKVDDRPGFMRKLAAAGIATSVMCRRNDAHSCMADVREELPGLDKVHDRLVHIPVGWWLTDQDRRHIVDTIRSGW
ncbi:DegT/DnrJ/EryC1/StrS family aminotransferase [Micromonospora sp. NPDC003776]